MYTYNRLNIAECESLLGSLLMKCTVSWCIWNQGTYNNSLTIDDWNSFYLITWKESKSYTIKHMSKEELKIQKKYVWNCRRCFLLGLLFKLFLEGGGHNYNPLIGRDTHHPYSSHHRFVVWKCQIAKSQAFKTKYNGHPGSLANGPCVQWPFSTWWLIQYQPYRAYTSYTLRYSWVAHIHESAGDEMCSPICVAWSIYAASGQWSTIFHHCI